MFARALLASILLSATAAAQSPILTVPLGKKPRQIERPKAPIEESGPQWAAVCKDWDEWDRPAPPVRIHANTYLVGTCGISSILIAGEEGHVLIDGGTEQGAELVAENIRQLGFRLGDIKYLLISHEHHDHVGGIARLQQLTGATLVASAPAEKALNLGVVGSDDPQSGLDKPYPAANVGRVIADGGDVLLGNIRMFAMTTHGSRPFAELAFEPGDVFVFGSETRGLAPEFRESFPTQQRIRLPMMPGNRSLNLSNTVAVVVFEAWRQHGYAGGA